MADAILFTGLQGAGKTTYYTTHFAATHVHISLDVHGSVQRQRAVLEQTLSQGKSFVLDNTNPTRAARAPFIAQAKAAGYRIIAYVFDVPVRTAIGRNNHRTDKQAIPVPAILRTAKQLEPPNEDEGFDEVRVIRPQAP